MARRFDDRTEAATYEDDPLAGFFPSDDPDSDVGVWMPDRIFYRLVNLGRAYELHRLPLLLDGVDAVILNAQQVKGLIEELEFVASITSDPLTRRWVDKTITVAQHVVATGGSLTADPH